ncbi:isochorismate synthase [Serratia sp. M24T3]|uniref:isochorismate synthase n=1 Tax=Serratia sp. M24T3 TaxID=932213 RepID=UPI00025B8EC5|nr:isochorismate synthase [Serratia sp. M24T3]EIC84588.1 isochorismate synthase [Serratia sp. M24T3]
MDTVMKERDVLGEESVNPGELSPTSGFFFTSAYRSLSTEGCLLKVTASAADGDAIDGEFQRAIKTAFIDAHAAGIKHPVLGGAIPFDKRLPSALFVPQKTRWLDRPSAMASAMRTDSPLPEIESKTELPAQNIFMQMVGDAVQAMNEGRLDKAVLSRLLEIKTRNPVSRDALMNRVVAQNPNGYHFHVPLEKGALIGASPELLLRKHGNQFYSNPLAGSARRESSPQKDEEVSRQLLNSGKDLYEHHIVIEGMRKVLAERSHSLQSPDSPELLSTPTLWHLSTPIKGEARDARENALSLACLLHPTPALCGSPTNIARDLIEQLEPFDRGLFGGIVGWCDDRGNGEWVVTIRCGTVVEDQVRLFAGAGIVPDSSPESEWHETGVKLNTMLRAFGLH